MLFILRLILLLVLFSSMLSSCSSSEESEQDGIIKKTTDEMAQQAVSSIKTPIEQAKLAKEIQENHNREVQETIDQQ